MRSLTLGTVGSTWVYEDDLSQNPGVAQSTVINTQKAQCYGDLLEPRAVHGPVVCQSQSHRLIYNQ